MRFAFGSFVLDTDTRQLLLNNRDVHLEPRGFELLTALLLERPKVMSKADLLHRLWPDTFVAEANLSNLVAQVRAALGDKARAPRFIRTAHGFGYAFCGETRVLRSSATSSRGVPCWIEWGRRRFPLEAGENVIGRDSDVDIQLDASTISRRHACIAVSPVAVTLEDLGSKNGTFRGDDRIESAVPLTDGDTVRLGSLVITFHVRAAAGSTATQGSTR